MTVMRSAELPVVTRRHRLESLGGLSVEVLENGALTALEAHGLSLLLFPSSAAEAGPANVHLRQRDGDRMRHVPLLGPASPSRVRVTGAGLQATGRWGALGYRLTLRPAEQATAWCWHLDVTNHGDDDAVVDAVLTHDPALASAAAVATNEYYVSQYLDITPVPTPDHGTAVGVRQNMPGPRHPPGRRGTARRSCRPRTRCRASRRRS